MVSDEEDLDCPLCMEELDIADRNFRPCPCGYQICRFCWHHIKSNLNGRCPACRRMYSDQIVEFIPVSAEEILRIKKEKKEKERQQREMKDPSRRHLSNVRVVQKNLVYVLGLGSKHASVENEIFKTYGKINKLVVSKRSANSTTQTSIGIYITYARKEDAAKAVAGLNGSTHDGKLVRASYGTTKYCTYYLRHMACPNPNCMYLHEPGDDVDSYNKENPTVGKHPSTSTQAYPNKRQAAASTATAPTAKPLASSSSNTAARASTQPRTWAPIPKVVPVKPKPATPEPNPSSPIPNEVSESPVTKTAISAAKTKNDTASPKVTQAPKPSVSTEKLKSATGPVKSIPSLSKSVSESSVKADEKPALPATASWANGPSNTANQDNVITPETFGPSLSDALSAPQKPKHTTSISRKKEKKLKSKMMRLEEFEEAVKEAKVAKAKAKPKKEWDVVTINQAAPVKETFNQEDTTPTVEIADVNNKAIPVVNEQKPGIEEVDKEQPVTMQKPNASDEQQDVDTCLQGTEEITSFAQEEGIKNMEEVNPPESSAEEEDKQAETVPDLKETSSWPTEQVSEEPAVMNDAANEILEDETDRADEEMIEIARGLNNAGDEIVKAFDVAAYLRSVDRTEDTDRSVQKQIEVEESEKVQDDELDTSNAQDLPSPLVAMERFSALVDQELMADSPEQPMEEYDFKALRPAFMNDLPAPSSNTHRTVLPTGPPPGLGVPPGWGTQNFDPFNRQDPAMMRRLQHSQQMLEASGLFHGFAPPVPRFGFSPDFHPGHARPSFAGQGPPMNMFNPQHPPMIGHPPMERPELMGLPPMMPPQMENHDIASLRGDFRGMQLQQDGLDYTRKDSVTSMREDFRAMLPNVNISFGPLQDEPPNRSPAKAFAKPHTPSNEEPDMYFRRLSQGQQDKDVSERKDLSSDMHRARLDSFASSRHSESSPGPLSQGKALVGLMQSDNVRDGRYPPGLSQFPPNEHEQGRVHKPDAYFDDDAAPAPRISQQEPYSHRPSMDQMLLSSPLRQETFGRSDDGFQVHDGGSRSEAAVRREAQNFFGEFLRKAASSNQSYHGEEVNNNVSTPFHDPAIMSVRVGGAPEPVPDMEGSARSQNTILQILGGHMHQQQPQQQQQPQGLPLRNQMELFPPEYGRMFPANNYAHRYGNEANGNNDPEMPPEPFSMFMGPPPAQAQFGLHPQQQQQHQQQQLESFPPPPPFLSGFNETPIGMMGRMPPPPSGMRDGPPFHHHHHPMMAPPPSMPGSDIPFPQGLHGLPPGMFPGRPSIERH
ncbi:transcriptional repressor proteinral negative regulator of transcription subunit 4 [Apophysomyces ossiformis]|uniref:Transcriptional repressor proteinral negative regulator of transcription subunit 4 n=1 Tax=Apophysomyces ossiformis TaxID=679940 RepID=A0A8H7BZU8_9FUNG|nr:transcriptional repressor proteinral negative regulator of transcription subunit 4 [Apophysomyces ossiformis]